MIHSEDCYLILDIDEGEVASDYADVVFESVKEAELFIEAQDDDVENYNIISLLQYIED